MYCNKVLPNDEDVRDSMAMEDLKEIISFFNKCKNTKKLNNWKEIKISCLNGLTHSYSCAYEKVYDEIKRTCRE